MPEEPTSGPPLDHLLRRLIETPPDFLAAPIVNNTGEMDVAAIVGDVLADLGAAPLSAEQGARIVGQDAKPARLRVLAIAAWLLRDPWFLKQPRASLATAAFTWLEAGLDDVATLNKPDRFVSDPDRREELARRCLRALGLRPAGESEAQAQDRLTTLDSVEMNRVTLASRRALERAREIQAALERKAAEEAAASYNRE